MPLSNRYTVLKTCILFQLAMIIVPAIAGAEMGRDFNLPAQALADALRAVGSQASVNVVFEPSAVRNKRAPALQGSYSVQEALARLLDGTGLSVRVTNGGSFVIGKTPTGEAVSSESVASDTTLMRLAQEETAAVPEDPASNTPADATRTKEDPAKIEEIVVTAQKREERLQDVPISISVLSGENLERSADQGVIDALRRVPGVSVVSTVGQNRLGAAGTVIIRGVAPAVGQGTTGYYLDMIPFGFVRGTTAPDTSSYDLQRIEVLRGPQGTLYGVNALNGVVRVLTKDPDLNQLAFKARTSVSSTEQGGENYRGDMAVNVPIVEGKLAARAVVGYQNWDGWIDSLYFGKNDNDFKDENYRLKIKAQPTENLTLSLMGWISSVEAGRSDAAADGKTNVIPIREPRWNDIEAFGLEIGYEFPMVPLRSMTSYLDYENHSLNDFLPFTRFSLLVDQTFGSEVFSQEVVLNSKESGPWRWSLGGIYREAADDGQGALGGGPFSATEESSESFAIFGELARKFFDERLELVGGLRYFEDKIFAHEVLRAGVVPTDGYTSEGTFDKVTPRIVLTWYPMEQATLYASYSMGFRSGINQTLFISTAYPELPSAKPDSLENYEIGMKNKLWGGRLSLDTSIYYVNWKDVQQDFLVVAGLSLAGAFVNGPSASGGGIDFGVTVEPIDGLKFSGGIGWNDLAMDGGIVDPNGVVALVEGSRLLNSPETTANLSVDYNFPVSASGARALLSASANYVSRTRTTGTTAFGTSSLYEDATWWTRMSGAIQFPQNWTLTAFIDNVLNDDGYEEDRYPPLWNRWIRPRTVGLQVEFSY